MRMSEHWLREWVNPACGTQALADQLTLAGLEVDALEPVAPAFDMVVVGRVLNVVPHPNAERLKVCTVDVGGGDTLTIVCGASNVAEGQRVPAALVGAVLPGGKRIERASLRGVESAGMLCSAVELGLADSSTGLLILPPEAPTGQAVRDYLRLDDFSIELGVTPNRGDCLSVLGVAREVAAINDLPLNEPAGGAVAASIGATFPVEVNASQGCPLYLGRVLRDVNPHAQTPLWLKERLRRSGLRSISPVVDVTNYVLLELGQPMHAFDLDKLSGGIVVCEALAGEEITLLDGKTISLSPGTLVITDANGPTAIAGVMGGQGSAVGEATTSLFLESAFFAPDAIAGRARQYGLVTESSRRFERGVDPNLPRRAMDRATALLLDIVGGQAGPVVEKLSAEQLPLRGGITLRAQRIERLLGCALTDAEVEGILRRLGMHVVVMSPGQWRVTPPSYRFDITIEADLIEELARIYGYGRLPSAKPRVDLSVPAAAEGRLDPRCIRQLLVDRGYFEAITYSFVDPQLQRHLQPNVPAVRLSNPIAADLAEMRTTLWPGLLQALVYNHNRQQARVRLFEVGRIYLPGGRPAQEREVVAGVAIGNCAAEQWGVSPRVTDFFDVKGDVEALLALTGYGGDFIFTADHHPALHPGQSGAVVAAAGERIGWIGTLHPELQRLLDLPQSVVMFQLEVAPLRVRTPRFVELSKFPTIRRDLAIVVDESASARSVLECVRRTAGVLLRELQLFDVYRGERIDSGRKSLALGLTLQDTSRTLTDADVDAVLRNVLEQLNSQLGATLRE